MITTTFESRCRKLLLLGMVSILSDSLIQRRTLGYFKKSYAVGSVQRLINCMNRASTGLEKLHNAAKDAIFVDRYRLLSLKSFIFSFPWAPPSSVRWNSPDRFGIVLHSIREEKIRENTLENLPRFSLLF